MYEIFNARYSLQLLVLTFLAILFLQSGLDKVFNYKDNYEYFKSHFSKSALNFSSTTNAIALLSRYSEAVSFTG